MKYYSSDRKNSVIYNRIFLMPTTRKQKKAGKSIGLEIMSDIENLDVVLGGNHFEREENEDSIIARRPETANCNASDNDESPHLNTREDKPGNSTDRGQNSTGASSSAEFNRISGELNLRIPREMDEMMKSVIVQIQRAINDAISNQILPQIQNAFKAGSGQTKQKGWNVPTEKPEYDTEDCRNDKIRSNSRSELIRNRLNDDLTDQAYSSNLKIVCKTDYEVALTID